MRAGVTPTTSRMHTLAMDLARKRRALERFKAQMAEAQAEHDRLEQDLFDAIEEQGLRAVKVRGVGTFSLNDLAWAKIEDEPAAREWADQAMPELLTLNRSRLSVLVREYLKGERAELPAGVGYSTTRKINWRKETT